MKKYTYLLSALLLASCTGRVGNNGKQVITVTIEPQRYFTEAIAGDKFNVKCMVPKGSSPETYDPTPQQLVELDKSTAYLRIGFIGFEQSWAKRLHENAKRLKVFDTSKGINLIFEAGQVHGDHQHLGSADPHIWNSASSALIIAENTYKALAELDPNNEAYYAARRDSLLQEIKHTDRLIREELSGSDVSRAFMIYHPALSYYARDYSLHQIPIEESGKEPSPSYLKGLIDECRAENVRVIFIQPEFDKRNAEIIANETHTHIVPINPLNYNWHEEMIQIAKALANH